MLRLFFFLACVFSFAPAMAQEEREFLTAKEQKEFESVPLGAALSGDRLLDSLGKCAEATNRSYRLLCYDTVALDLGLMPADRHQTESNILEQFGLWESTHIKNSLGEDLYYFKLLPDNDIEGRSPLGRPELVVRCKLKETQFYLDWKADMASLDKKAQTIYIGRKVDNDQLEGWNWQLSLDKLAAFTPNPVEFLRELNGKEKLYLELTTGPGGMKVLMFSLDGLDKVLETVVEKCYR